MTSSHRLPRIPRERNTSKPRLLVVDDHQGVLDRVSALLAEDFDIAGTATDGTQALESARLLEPDGIVLDINMPGPNGFETMRALEQSGSRAPVVFLSMFESEEFVSEAFRCGGRGYVLKPFMARDLASALDQVLLGRRFGPTLAPLLELTPGTAHAMHVHSDVDTLLDDLAGVFDLALNRGDATCVIATEDVRDGLRDRLRSRGWDAGSPSRHPRYRVFDAQDALTAVMRDGLPDRLLLAEMAAELDRYRSSATAEATSRLVIFGNMNLPLIAGGNAAAAMVLETVWNELTHGLRFVTICGYARSCFDEAAGLWSQACAAHQAVSHTRDV